MYEGDGDIRMTSTMELSIGNKLQPLHFRFENTKHKLGVRICGMVRGMSGWMRLNCNSINETASSAHYGK